MRTSALTALVLLATLAGCSRDRGVSATATSTAAAEGRVGYVQMDVLVKRHPLYTQLSKYDADIAALSLRSMRDVLPRPAVELAREDAILRAELKDAADRTKRLIAAKQSDYARRENAAIANALRAQSAAAQGPDAAGLSAAMNATATRQRGAVAQSAQSDLESYRLTLIRQDRGAVEAASKNLSARATRTFRARADELQAKESALSLELASRDATERLGQRTRLSNLALDEAGRDEARNALAALDRKEADEVAAMRNRDQQTLATLQAQLSRQVKTELASQAQSIHARSVAKLRAREAAARRVFANRPPAAVVASSANAGAGLPPDMQAKIAGLHKGYQAQFDRDAKATVANFNRTRDELQKRFTQLHAVNASAQAGAQRQIASLQHQRDELYTQMVAQIDREVRSIAQKQGISVVLSGVVAPGGGVDLTPAAQREIESLHE